MSEPVIATVKEMARWLDCTPTRIRKLAAEGTVVKLGVDRYDRNASVTAMIKRLRDRVERQGAVDPANLQASARLRMAKVELLREKLRREAGRLLDVEEARATWREIVRGTSAMVLGLAPKIFAALPALTPTDRETIAQLLADDLRDAALERGFDLRDAALDRNFDGGGPGADDDEHDPPPAA